MDVRGMRWTTVRAGVGLLAGMVLLLGPGCGSHYRVTEPGSGRVYYTKHVEHQKGGAVEFEDARTKSKVTIQSSEVTKISEHEFKEGIKAHTPAK